MRCDAVNRGPASFVLTRVPHPLRYWVSNVVANIDEWWTSEVPAQRFLLNRKDVRKAEADPGTEVTKKYHYLAEHLSVLRRVSSKGFRHRNKMNVDYALKNHAKNVEDVRAVLCGTQLSGV